MRVADAQKEKKNVLDKDPAIQHFIFFSFGFPHSRSCTCALYLYHVLGIVSTDKILLSTNTFIIIIIIYSHARWALQ